MGDHKSTIQREQRIAGPTGAMEEKKIYEVGKVVGYNIGGVFFRLDEISKHNDAYEAAPYINGYENRDFINEKFLEVKADPENLKLKSGEVNDIKLAIGPSGKIISPELCCFNNEECYKIADVFFTVNEVKENQDIYEISREFNRLINHEAINEQFKLLHNRLISEGPN